MYDRSLRLTCLSTAGGFFAAEIAKRIVIFVLTCTIQNTYIHPSGGAEQRFFPFFFFEFFYSLEDTLSTLGRVDCFFPSNPPPLYSRYPRRYVNMYWIKSMRPHVQISASAPYICSSANKFSGQKKGSPIIVVRAGMYKYIFTVHTYKKKSCRVVLLL